MKLVSSLTFWRARSLERKQERWSSDVFWSYWEHISRWWFQIFVIFSSTWRNDPIWTRNASDFFFFCGGVLISTPWEENLGNLPQFNRCGIQWDSNLQNPWEEKSPFNLWWEKNMNVRSEGQNFPSTWLLFFSPAFWIAGRPLPNYGNEFN